MAMGLASGVITQLHLQLLGVNLDDLLQRRSTWLSTWQGIPVPLETPMELNPGATGRTMVLLPFNVANVLFFCRRSSPKFVNVALYKLLISQYSSFYMHSFCSSDAVSDILVFLFLLCLQYSHLSHVSFMA